MGLSSAAVPSCLQGPENWGPAFLWRLCIMQGTWGSDTCPRGCFAEGALVVTVVVAGVGVLSAELLS